MLTEREAFHVGFLLRCADGGLTPAQTTGAVDKAASLAGQAGGLGNFGASTIGSLGTKLLVGLPIGVGALGGYLVHKATEDDVDVDDIRKRELIDELKHWTRRARETSKTKAFHSHA